MKPAVLYSDAPARGWLPWGALAPFVCLVLVALPDAGASLLLLRPLGLLDAQENPVGVAGWCAYLVVTFTGMAGVFYAWLRLVERRPLATIGLTGARPGRAFAVGVGAGLGLVAALVAAIALAGGYRVGAVAPAFASPSALAGIGLLFPCFVLQSSVEEMIFRGWLLSGIARKLGVPLAVTLSSLTFTLLHYERGQQWAATLAIFLFGVFACAWSLRTGSVWRVMGWHAAWNWLLAVGFDVPVTALRTHLPALLVALTPVKGPLVTGGAQGPEGSLACSAVLLAGIAWLGWGYVAAARASSSAQRA